jgi:large subunit ribosomal protein L29
MAKKKADKKEDFSTLSVAELQVRLKELRESSFRMKFRHATSPLKNPLDIRVNRRAIARVHTFLRQKEVRV